MAHHRRNMAAATALNAGIFIAEGVAGREAHSLSLLTDGVHNFSDELGLAALLLAYLFVRGPSRFLLRSANLINSVGIIFVSVVLLWEAVTRLVHPAPTRGAVALLVGLAAAAANWGVARLLARPAALNPAVRLAYLHNLGDVWVSLAPALAGGLLLATGYSFFDPLIASAVAIWLIVSTVQEVAQSRDALLWPEAIVCDHPEHF